MRGGILHLKDIKQMERFAIDSRTPLYKSICNIYVFNDSNYIDFDWIEKQMTYINNLTPKQKHIIRVYTIYADKLINGYLRNILHARDIERVLDISSNLQENPFKYYHYERTGSYNINGAYKRNIRDYIAKFITDFSEIIQNAPKLTRQIKVFRGVKTDKYLIDNITNNGNGNKIFINKDFTSTSIYLESATRFMENDCCLLELVLDITTPCLFTAHISRCGTEYEITIAPQTVMKYLGKTKKGILDNPDYYESTDILLQPSKYQYDIANVYEFIVTGT